MPPSGECDEGAGAGRVKLAVGLDDLAEASYVSDLRWFEVSSLHTRLAVWRRGLANAWLPQSQSTGDRRGAGC